jgi:hypothetical protein
MRSAVCTIVRQHCQVLGSVVQLVEIDVMHDFAKDERSAHKFFADPSMFLLPDAWSDPLSDMTV